jgi:hypothetical protein
VIFRVAADEPGEEYLRFIGGLYAIRRGARHPQGSARFSSQTCPPRGPIAVVSRIGRGRSVNVTTRLATFIASGAGAYLYCAAPPNSGSAGAPDLASACATIPVASRSHAPSSTHYEIRAMSLEGTVELDYAPMVCPCELVWPVT